MTYELTQRFFFEAAHTLQRASEIDGGAARDASRRIHGHTYTARVTVGGEPAASGMVVDLALLRAQIERARALLDHRLLDDVPELGAPTLENLCAFIHRELARHSGWRIVSVEVGREASGDSCTLRPA
jgi:6-pyruvoyltetrahydropterin/6-carboxytetrahydropterin synthase